MAKIMREAIKTILAIIAILALSAIPAHAGGGEEQLPREFQWNVLWSNGPNGPGWSTTVSQPTTLTINGRPYYVRLTNGITWASDKPTSFLVEGPQVKIETSWNRDACARGPEMEVHKEGGLTSWRAALWHQTGNVRFTVNGAIIYDGPLTGAWPNYEKSFVGYPAASMEVYTDRGLCGSFKATTPFRVQTTPLQMNGLWWNGYEKSYKLYSYLGGFLGDDPAGGPLPHSLSLLRANGERVHLSIIRWEEREIIFGSPLELKEVALELATLVLEVGEMTTYRYVIIKAGQMELVR